ncbi:hypothetical protein GCM10009551_015430 [Nocardiopsis tropica]|uniref:hypothetical protein n=1 Tax=Nocardiopsis tropica TaxID=109330 RepID=UPI0031DF769D
MTGRAGIAVDDDSTWCAWTTAGGLVRAMELGADRSGEIVDAGRGTAVHAGSGTGRFLVHDGEDVRSWSPDAGTRSVCSAEPGSLLLEPGGASGHEATLVAAASESELALLSAAGTVSSQRLGAPPLVLAWQHRRRRILCVLADGTVHKLDPRTARTDTSSLSFTGNHRLACYDEVLGGVWSVPEQSPDTAHFHRTEADRPGTLYTLGLGTVPAVIRSSHSGEWLIAATPGRPTMLTNVNSGRSFTVPGELAARGAPGVFSFDNRLVSVEGDAFEVLPVPARADVRSRDGSLPIETFWSAPPQMHRATRRPKEERPRGEGGGTRVGAVS